MNEQLEQDATTTDTHKIDLPPYSTPRWVKVFGIVVLILFVLIGIMLLSGGHEPRSHFPAAHDKAPTEHGTQHP